MSFEVLMDQRNRAEWLKGRQDGIGSSDAAAVLGLSPWASPLSVYADKLGLGEEIPEGEPAYWGKILEPHVIIRFGDLTKRRTHPAGELLRSTEREWQLCTLDATQYKPESSDPGVLECKVTQLYYNWNQGVPPYVYAQVQHQLAVTGYSWASVAVLFRGANFYWKDVPRDEEFIAHLIKTEEHFWGCVLNQLPPAPDASDATKEAIKRLYPEDDGEIILLEDGHWLALDEKRTLIAEEVKRLNAVKQGYDNEIKMAIGEASGAALIDGTQYTLKADKRKVRSLRRKQGRDE